MCSTVCHVVVTTSFVPPTLCYHLLKFFALCPSIFMFMCVHISTDQPHYQNLVVLNLDETNTTHGVFVMVSLVANVSVILN